MKKSSKVNWIDMNKASDFSLYSPYFAWKREAKSGFLQHFFTHVQFMLLMALGVLKKKRAYISQSDLAKFLSFYVTMTSQVLKGLEKRGLFRCSQKKGDECFRLSELRGAVIAKIQVAAKNLLESEESFFVILSENKEEFDDYLRGILDKKTGDHS